MINIIKGNVAYLNGVMNLYLRVKNDFKQQGVNIYQDNEYFIDGKSYWDMEKFETAKLLWIQENREEKLNNII